MKAAYPLARIAWGLAALTLTLGLEMVRAQVTDTPPPESQKRSVDPENVATNSPPETVPEQALRAVGPSDMRFGFEGGWRHSLNGEYFGEGNFGGMGFMDVTNAELRNDWLKDFSYVGLRVGLKLVF